MKPYSIWIIFKFLDKKDIGNLGSSKNRITGNQENTWKTWIGTNAFTVQSTCKVATQEFSFATKLLTSNKLYLSDRLSLEAVIVWIVLLYGQ